MTRRITRFPVPHNRSRPITLDIQFSFFSFQLYSWKKYLCVNSYLRTRSIRIIILHRMYFNLLERRNHAQLATPSPFYTPSELFSDRPALMVGGNGEVGAVPVILLWRTSAILPLTAKKKIQYGFFCIHVRGKRERKREIYDFQRGGVIKSEWLVGSRCNPCLKGV